MCSDEWLEGWTVLVCKGVGMAHFPGHPFSCGCADGGGRDASLVGGAAASGQNASHVGGAAASGQGTECVGVPPNGGTGQGFVNVCPIAPPLTPRVVLHCGNRSLLKAGQAMAALKGGGWEAPGVNVDGGAAAGRRAVCRGDEACAAAAARRRASDLDRARRTARLRWCDGGGARRRDGKRWRCAMRARCA